MSIAVVDQESLTGTGVSAAHAATLIAKINELVTEANALRAEVDASTYPGVANLAALKAIAAVDLKDRISVICETLGTYRYDAESSASGDDIGVVVPTNAPGGVGRFIRTTPPTVAHDHSAAIYGGRLTEVALALKTVVALANQAGVITAAQLLASNIMSAAAMTADRIYTTDTAANIVAVFVGAGIGTDFEFDMYNPTAYKATIAAGAQITLDGTGVVPAGTTAHFKGKILTLTGNGAVTIWQDKPLVLEGTTTPAATGAAAVGSALTASASDHVHALSNHGHLGVAGDGGKITRIANALLPILTLTDDSVPLTAAQLVASDTLYAPVLGAPRTKTMEAASVFVAAFAGCGIGSYFYFDVSTVGAANNLIVAVPGSITLVGSGTVLAGTCARFKAVFTNVSGGTEAITLFRVAADVPAAIVALVAGKTFVYGSAVIDAAAATDVVATGLAAIQGFGVTLEDAPLLAEVMWLSAAAAAGNLTTSAWTCTAAGDTNPKVGVGKAVVGTKYTWWAVGTV